MNFNFQFQYHTPEFSSAGQILPDDLAAIAAAGYRSVINNRPDGEAGPQQPDSASMAEAAKKLGLHYAYLPVSSPIDEHTVRQFGALLATLPGPVLAHCRSGNRSTILYQRSLENPPA